MIYLIDPKDVVLSACPVRCTDKCSPKFYPLYGVPT